MSDKRIFIGFMHAILLVLSARAYAGDDTLFLDRSPVNQSERIRRLSTFFTPLPLDAEGKALDDGKHALTIPPAAYRDLAKGYYVGELQGSIEVTPPKGRCLTITKDRKTRDVRVCKKTFVPFRLDELSVAGVLTWMVSTGADDTGTFLSWQTPHRIALVIGINEKIPSDSLPEFINSCEAFNDEGGRRIQLHFFDGRVWTVRFPDRDIMLPQPPPPPNLHVTVKSEVNIGTGKQPASKSKSQPPPSPHSSPSATPTIAPAPDISGEQMPWTVTSKLTYVMSSAFLLPDGISTPGIHGKCRYRFSDPDYHLVGGIIECQNAPGYAYVVAPLACSGVFSPRTTP